jgi:CBS domain-containing membrane protein
LHPPGGAVALATVLAAPAGIGASLIWLCLTVFAGSALLVAFGVAYHRTFDKPYPSLT